MLQRMTNSGPSPWEDEAERWTAWARTPGHDVFPYFAPAFFEEIVPPAPGLTLEVGCGEGRVARELTARGHRVVALDVSPSLVRAACEADARAAYAVGDAMRLPFAAASYATVVAYNSLQTMRDVADMARAVAEAARVLAFGGRYCFCVAHPMTDVGRLERPGSDADAVVSGAYFGNRRVEETVEKDGLAMTFHGWTYTLEDYARATEAAGLTIERIREPAPAEAAAATRASLGLWRRVPLFLSVRAVKQERIAGSAV